MRDRNKIAKLLLRQATTRRPVTANRNSRNNPGPMLKKSNKTGRNICYDQVLRNTPTGRPGRRNVTPTHPMGGCVT